MNHVADALTIVTGVIASWLALASLSGPARRIVALRLTLAKATTIGRELRHTPLSRHPGVSRLGMYRSISARVRQRTRGEATDVADELEWLARHLGREQGVTFVDDDELPALQRLAEQYQRLSARLTTRVILGSQPLVEAEADLARSTAIRLAVAARRLPAIDARQAGRPADWTATAGPPSAASRIELYGVGPARYPAAHDLVVSARRLRHVVDSAATRERATREGSAPVVVPIAGTAGLETTAAAQSQAHFYDGTLPALLDHRFERDSRTGKHRLHLSVAELSFSAHTALAAGPPEQAPDTPRLLTLSMVPITLDGHLIIVRRAATGRFYPGNWAPGVNGNLDMPDPLNQLGDATPDGLPDPVAALCREGAEELGVVVDPTHVLVHGLARIENATEHGTWILLTTGRLALTLDQLRDRTTFADPVEGAWEADSTLLAVPRLTTPQDAADLLTWAWSNDDVMPHLAAVLLAHARAERLLPGPEWPGWNAGGPAALPATVRTLTFG